MFESRRVRHCCDNMNPYLQLTRPFNSIFAALGVIIIIFLAQQSLTYSELLPFAFLTTFFSTAGGNAINDYFDAEIDKKNRPTRPIPSGKIKKQTVLYYSLILLFLSAISAYMINTTAFFITTTAIILLVTYNKIKRTTLLGNFIIASLTALVPIFAGAVINNYSVSYYLASFIFLATLAREITKDIEDIKGDRGTKQTLPIKFGIKPSAILATVSLLLLISVLFVQNIITSQYYLYLITPTILIYTYCSFFLLKSPKSKANQLQKLEKLGMLTGLLAFFMTIFL